MKTVFSSKISLKLFCCFILIGPIALFIQRYYSSQDLKYFLGALLTISCEAFLFWTIYKELKERVK